MTNKLMLLSVVLSLVLTLGLVIACGDDDDDDNDDNDVSDDDTGDDDDSGLACADVYAIMYTDCNLRFFEEDGVTEIPMEDVINWCNEGALDGYYSVGGDVSNCIVDNAECEDIQTCLEGLIE